MAEVCIIGIPDKLKGQLPFAFIAFTQDGLHESAVPDSRITQEIQNLVRNQVGAFASIGGIIQGKGMIPKTRSGKTLRRVLRGLVENGVHGEFTKEVVVPSTVEDAAVIDIARVRVKEYFEASSGKHKAIEG